jgi:hypothetical protein
MGHPRLWGDTFWNTMHMLAALIEASADKLGGKVNTLARTAFIGFLCNLPPILPCPSCVKDAPVIFMARLEPPDQPPITERIMSVNLNELMCVVHNDVNRKLHKEEMPLEVAMARVVHLGTSLNTKLIWDFLIMSARSLRPPATQVQYKQCIRCLSVMLRALGHSDLANIATGIAKGLPFKDRAPNAVLAFLYEFYLAWHTQHKLPCPSKAEFISKQTYPAGRRSPLGLADEA